MSYYVDWRKPIKVSISATVALLVSIGLQYVFGGIGLIVLTLFFFWVLVVVILFWHISSSLKIENGVVSHLVFGFVKREYPIEQFSELKLKAGLYPGIVKFKTGESFFVSGIALGNNLDLARALQGDNEKQHEPTK